MVADPCRSTAKRADLPCDVCDKPVSAVPPLVSPAAPQVWPTTVLRAFSTRQNPIFPNYKVQLAFLPGSFSDAQRRAHPRRAVRVTCCIPGASEMPPIPIRDCPTTSHTVIAVSYNCARGAALWFSVAAALARSARPTQPPAKSADLQLLDRPYLSLAFVTR